MAYDAIAPPIGDPPAKRQREAPSLFAVNLFLVVGIGTVLVAGVMAGEGLSRYTFGIGAEIILAGLALGFAAVERAPIAKMLRLRAPRWEALAAIPVIAPGLWVTSIGLNLISTLLLGYNSPVSPSAFPTTPMEALLLALATVVVAPICEEIVFRGYVQRAYEARAPWLGILGGGIIFAAYHLRFQGLMALIPVSIVLGWLAWQTDSIWPSILLHSIYNGLATVVLLTTSFAPIQVMAASVLALLCLGTLMVAPAAGALWGLKIVLPSPIIAKPPALQKGWLRWAWVLPLLILGGLYCFAAAAEVMVGAFPQSRAVTALDLQPPTGWAEPGRWTYVIETRLGQTIGKAICSQSVTGSSVQLACTTELDEEPEDFPIPALRAYAAAPEQWRKQATWNRNTLTLESLTATRTITDNTTSLVIGPGAEPGSLSAATDSAGGSLGLSADTLAPQEWPWRLAALPFDAGHAIRTEMLVLTTSGNVEQVAALVVIRGGEPIWTPSGTHITWEVTVSYEDSSGIKHTDTAWYEAAAPHRLVRYDEGMLRYLLSD